jgi:hypothetical protein
MATECDQRSLEPFRVVLGVVGEFSRASASYFHFLALSLVIFPPFYFHNYIIYLAGGGGVGWISASYI